MQVHVVLTVRLGLILFILLLLFLLAFLFLFLRERLCCFLGFFVVTGNGIKIWVVGILFLPLLILFLCCFLFGFFLLLCSLRRVLGVVILS